MMGNFLATTAWHEAAMSLVRHKPRLLLQKQCQPNLVGGGMPFTEPAVDVPSRKSQLWSMITM